MRYMSGPLHPGVVLVNMEQWRNGIAGENQDNLQKVCYSVASSKLRIKSPGIEPGLCSITCETL
jgi:hypothetical protein